MQKQIKIPQKKKINLDKLDETKEFERYTIQIQKIKEENSLPKKVKKTERTSIQIIKSITSIISVLIFILIVCTLALKILSDLKPQQQPVQEKEKINLTTNIIGSWQSATNGLFVFNEDNTFYWYNSYNNLQDNYYKGNYNYKTGSEAIQEMGFTEEEFQKEYGSEIKLENVYSINLQPTLILKDQIDVTTVEIDENKSWWYILIIKDDYTANGFNKTLDIKYNLIKKSE